MQLINKILDALFFGEFIYYYFVNISLY